MQRHAKKDNESLICVDTGTTNTRVWLIRGDEVLATARAGVGVRDTAREGSPALLHNALRESIARVRESTTDPPLAVIAAGMITSPLGLREVPHLPAPVGLHDLAANVVSCRFPEITDLPIWLVPGVRSGPAECDRDSIGETDVMRGEETLCLGLAQMGLLPPGSTLLNLGSHWKLITLDSQSRIAGSLTSMSGELIHAAQTQTILAGSVPQTKPERIDSSWLRAGMREHRNSGLARALFCVRLLEQRGESSPEERLSFLIGAFLAADLDAMLSRRLLIPECSVSIAGGEALATAWKEALAEQAITAQVLRETEIEWGLLTGLRAMAEYFYCQS